MRRKPYYVSRSPNLIIVEDLASNISYQHTKKAKLIHMILIIGKDQILKFKD